MKDIDPPKAPPTPAHKFARPKLRFDWMEWLPYLEDSNIPDAQKRKWIETLWSIVIAFVDLGYDIKTDAETCGNVIDLKAALQAAVVNSSHRKNYVEEAEHGKR